MLIKQHFDLLLIKFTEGSHLSNRMSSLNAGLLSWGAAGGISDLP